MPEDRRFILSSNDGRGAATPRDLRNTGSQSNDRREDRTPVFRRGGNRIGPIIRKAKPVAPKPTPVAPTPAPAPPPPAAPEIPKETIGAINRSSGDSGSSALNAAAVKRARIAGTKLGDIISSVDGSRPRSKNSGIAAGGGNPIDTGVVT